MTMPKCQDYDFSDSRVAWFVVLERARADNNFQRAADGEAQLERLGVRVKYLRHAKQKVKDKNQEASSC